jgi:DNA polymerase-3 subunit delta'
VDGFLTVGQPAAAAAVHAMLASHVPHAILLVGPASVGKHALALDLAAALMCTGATGSDRPCRACRGCRLVDHGNHPDLHQLAPTGPGLQVRIGEDQNPEPGTIRRLAIDLALLPVEGGARVAIIRDAHRMNDVAQSALLKTLEEPPTGTTLVLCVDDEEQLLPTIRSRCARIRLGTVGARDAERLLERRELADPPTAARLARLAGGRPGRAVAYASAAGAETVRGELVRTLLDLLDSPPAARLQASRDLMARASELARMLVTALEPSSDDVPTPARRRGRVATVAPPVNGGRTAPDAPSDADEPADGGTGKVTASERRRALGLLLDIWRDLARDLACAQGGAGTSVRDVVLLEELESAASRLSPGASGVALSGLVRAGELLEANATPELVLDVLLLRWPRTTRAA